MAGHRIRVGLILAAAITAAPVLGAVPPDTPIQWDPGTANPATGTDLVLRNLVRDSPLRYVARAANPKLGWGPGGRFEFIPYNANPNIRDHRKKPLVSGQTYWIAYRAPPDQRTPGWFAGGSSTSGFSSTPVRYRVQIDTTNGNISLFNLTANDYLVYNAKTVVGTIGDLRGQEHDASIVLTAQPPVQGFVPFAGSYGGGVNFDAVLTQISNPFNGPPLAFVKPGYGSADCGDASAVIPLAAGASLGADQIKTLYGTAEPSLKARIGFLVCAVTNLGSVSVNIRYRDL